MTHSDIPIQTTEFISWENVTKDLFKVTSRIYSDISACGYSLQQAIDACELKIRLRRERAKFERIREENRKTSRYARK